MNWGHSQADRGQEGRTDRCVKRATCMGGSGGVRAEGWVTAGGGGGGAGPAPRVSACVCCLPLCSLDFAPSFHPSEQSAGARGPGSAPGSAEHWLCDFCIYFTLSAPAHSLVKQGNDSERLTSHAVCTSLVQ